MGAALSDTFAIKPISDVEAVISREFDAPRDLVFKAFTDPGAHPAVVGTAKHNDHRRQDGRAGRWILAVRPQGG